MTPASRATITDHGQIMPILRSRRQTARHHGLSGLPPIWERADPETGEPREDRRTREVATGALLHGPDDRPQAPCSDVIATAVRELLAAGPDPLALVRYADASWQVRPRTTPNWRRITRPTRWTMRPGPWTRQRWRCSMPPTLAPGPTRERQPRRPAEHGHPGGAIAITAQTRRYAWTGPSARRSGSRNGGELELNAVSRAC